MTDTICVSSPQSLIHTHFTGRGNCLFVPHAEYASYLNRLLREPVAESSGRRTDADRHGHHLGRRRRDARSDRRIYHP